MSEWLELQSAAEELKGKLWVFMEKHRLDDRKCKDAMNYVIDCIDMYEDEQSVKSNQPKERQP